MGTNYYAALNVCGCCGHPERKWHICKSFNTFKGWNYDGPLGHDISEFVHWLPVIEDERITILDEYGETIEKGAFVSLCHDLGPKRELSYDEMYRMYRRDPAGFVFYGGEFS